LSIGARWSENRDAAGNLWYSTRSTSASDLAGKARKEADDQGVLYGKVEALVAAGASRELLDELLKLDSVEEQIRVADAFLTNRGALASQNRAYADMGVWSEKIGKLVAATPTVATAAAGGATGAGSGVVLNITNNYPQAEPTSVTTNNALQTAAAIGAF
jgi:hypothetical protein